MTLTGPADADAFRDYVKGIGRVYVDPLDSCEIAEKTDAYWPSISAIKSGTKKDWTAVMVKRMAKLPPEEWHRIAGLDEEQRKEAMWAVNKHDLNVAAGRGSIIHWWAEDLLSGHKLREIDPDLLRYERIPVESLAIARAYKPALLDFFTTYDPELIAAEYVTIHRTLNGVGYGGTGDGILRLRKTKLVTAAVDWKSRDVTSQSRAYPDEGAQIAGGVGGEYTIVDDGNGKAVRAPLPDVEIGAVVSIKPDGARVYPIDLELAFKRFTKMHQWWLDSKEENECIGRVWPIVRATESPDPLEPIRQRMFLATDEDDLRDVWADYSDVWTHELTDLARRLKAELAGK